MNIEQMRLKLARTKAELAALEVARLEAELPAKPHEGVEVLACVGEAIEANTEIERITAERDACRDQMRVIRELLNLIEGCSANVSVHPSAVAAAPASAGGRAMSEEELADFYPLAARLLRHVNRQATAFRDLAQRLDTIQKAVAR